ncbi:anaphase-promoting complex subunit 10, putative [Bodo saltans]|uniref:Anaphase-promoting complex subunit 10, putative n=1 Tax=Bodo saltans TaxID=75058 RepID=A0A0S4JNN0_BODSA|nr:anaphase-promoting complex subunit 10, putative [Bodo saltans]|eukprot:CUG92043.1 anaphase-promoting complex subunit 10, putative [Bodo saltans]
MTARGRAQPTVADDDALPATATAAPPPVASAPATTTAAPSCIPHRLLTDVQLTEYSTHCREVGAVATWIVSSAKYGNGVHQLRDDNAQTFWQSDGALPHTVRVEFPKLTAVHAVAICLSFASDESYTPAKVSIRAGTHENDVAEVAVLDMVQPNGWVLQTLMDDTVTTPSPAPSSSGAPGEESSSSSNILQKPLDMRTASLAISKADSVTTLARHILSLAPIYCTVLLVLIPENHQQGRDTHVRGVKVFGAPLPSTDKLFGGFESLR